MSDMKPDLESCIESFQKGNFKDRIHFKFQNGSFALMRLFTEALGLLWIHCRFWGWLIMMMFYQSQCSSHWLWFEPQKSKLLNFQVSKHGSKSLLSALKDKIWANKKAIELARDLKPGFKELFVLTAAIMLQCVFTPGSCRHRSQE